MATRPKIVLLRIDQKDLFIDNYTVNKIRVKADVDNILTIEAANALFDGSDRPTVYAMDSALSRSEFNSLRAKAVTFVRTGGTIIFGARFSGSTNFDRYGVVFSAFSLPWQHGDYMRSNFDLNAEMQTVSHAGLSPRYSMKANHLVNVDHTDALYLPSASSPIQSLSTMVATPLRGDPWVFEQLRQSWMMGGPVLASGPPSYPSSMTVRPNINFVGPLPSSSEIRPIVFAPQPVTDFSQTPIALATVGEGKVGYIGDVNEEEETEDVVLAMLGLN